MKATGSGTRRQIAGLVERAPDAGVAAPGAQPAESDQRRDACDHGGFGLGDHRTRGEFVLLVHPQAAVEDDGGIAATTLQTLDLLLAELPVKTAVKLCAEITGSPRNALYQAALARKQGAADD